MDKFWELFQQSVIIQGVVTLILVVTLCVMFIRGQAIPELLGVISSLVLGYWFGSKSQHAIEKAKRL
jgi:hypothetical protein